MNPLKHTLFLLGFILIGTTWGFSQMVQKGTPDASEFPQVIAKINSRSPEAKTAPHFSLREGDLDLDFTVTAVEPEDSGSNKTVLVLWELLPHEKRRPQNAYCKQLLADALPRILQEGDKINVATFAWTDQDDGRSTLDFLTPGFTTDTSSLRKKVLDAKPSTENSFSATHGSELFPAISEGIETLASASNAKALIVVSAEFPNIYNRVGDVSMVTAKARETDVSVYNYRYKVMSDKYHLDDLAYGSYGLSHQLDPSNQAASLETLVGHVNSVTARSLGMDYEFTFRADSTLDGSLHTVQLNAGTEALTISFEEPAQGFGGWIAANPLIAGGIGLGILLLLGVILFLMRRNKKKQEEAEAEKERRMKEMEEKDKEKKAQLEAQQREIQNMKAQEAEKIQREKLAREQQRAQEERARLTNEMFSGGRVPRFNITAGEFRDSVELQGPVTVVGRDASSDIQIQHPTVSRNHLQITYREGKFMVTDLGSTNGTRINGEQIRDGEIKHGDMLEAGDVGLSFFT